MRLIHFSDIHLSVNQRLRRRDYLGKRLSGVITARTGRHHVFDDAVAITQGIVEFVNRQPWDEIIFTGDVTCLGTQGEFALAQQLFAGFQQTGIAVPGNHDHYVRESVRKSFFEATFAQWQQGQRLGAATYPFAKPLGEYTLIAANSSRPNWGLWDSRGQVGKAQRQRLQQLCATLPPGPRVLITHYPIWRPGHKVEHRYRLLRDRRAMFQLAQDCGIKVWLHGHKHQAIIQPISAEQPFATISPGSATQKNRWTIHEYQISSHTWTIIPHTWDPNQRLFLPGAATELVIQ